MTEKQTCEKCERLIAMLRRLLDEGEAYKLRGEEFDADKIEYVCPWCERRVNAASNESHDDDCAEKAASALLKEVTL